MPISTYWDALLLRYGTVGLYGLFQRLFIIYGILALSGSLLIDAPFGRFGWEKSEKGSVAEKGRVSKGWSRTLKNLTIPGDIGWLIMEIFSPLTFLLSLSLSLSPSPSPSPSLPSLSSLPQTFLSLTSSRQILITLYLTHYLNRSILSSLFFNPGRAKMHLIVPLAAIVFNILNGFLLGSYLGGGVAGEGERGGGWGIKEGREWLFFLGIILWIIGFAGNWYSDEILYRLKRTSSSSSSNATSTKSKKPSPTSPHPRYSIPHSFLYSHPFGGISHPSYFTEWIEWSGFLLATLSLSSPLSGWPEGVENIWRTLPPPIVDSLVGERGGWGGKIIGGLKKLLEANLLALGSGGEDGVLPLGVEALGGGGRVLKYLEGVPKELWPLKGWWLQPPALFLWNEIAAMLPRAISGHEWYKKTFGDEFPKERKRLIPGVF